MEFDRLLRKRASVRKYSSEKFNIDYVIKCIESANLAPSPGNLPILKYIIVEDKEKISRIAKACVQDFIQNAPYLVIVCSDVKKTRIMYEARAGKYIKQHAGAAIENFLLEAVNLGLASCWIGAFVDDNVKEILRIPDNIDVEAILPLAYSSKLAKNLQKKKLSLFNRIFFENWNNKLRVPFPKLQDI